MEDRNATILRCAWPRCNGQIWVERNLEICGGHARQVLGAMSREVNEMAGKPRDWAEELDIKALRRQVASLKAQLAAKDEPKASRSAGPKMGTVYYLRSGANIKIGWTGDLQKRMRNYPPDTTLLATEPGTRADETRLKRMFKVHLTHGNEWFAMVPSLTHHIAQVKAKHGEPDASITFAAQPVTIPQPRQPQYIGGNNRGNWQTGVVPTGLVG